MTALTNGTLYQHVFIEPCYRKLGNADVFRRRAGHCFWVVPTSAARVDARHTAARANARAIRSLILMTTDRERVRSPARRD